MKILKVEMDDESIEVIVPEELLTDAAEFFLRMDADMDGGFQMSREWVAKPNAYEKAQIAADKLLSAMENENKPTATMMAAYIISRFPLIESVFISTDGDMTQHELIF